MAVKTDSQFEQPSVGLLMANRYLWVILLVVVLVVLALGYFLILNPNIQKVAEAKDSVAKISATVDEVNTLIKQVSDLEAEFSQVKTQRASTLLRLQKVVPNNPEIAELFVLAEQLALNRGFVLQAVDFTEPEIAAVVEGQESQEKTGELSAISINMTVAQASIMDEGEETTVLTNIADPYDMFKQYLDDLESNLRLMDIESVSFSGAEGGLSMTFTIKTYFVKK